MTSLRVPVEESVYSKQASLVIFNQLALKIEMDRVSNEAYYGWLDHMIATIGQKVRGAKIVEKENARVAPPLNTAIYYDTAGHHILRTGALLRTSCNKITHAFCAFKMAEDAHAVRKDHRYVFADDEKRTIQNAPSSSEAVAIVKRLLARKDIEHPGTFLERYYGIRGEELSPAIMLDDYRYTFFAWLDNKDALRCSIDRAFVSDLRLPEHERERKPVSEVELAIYPRITPEVAKDQRVVELINTLATSLTDAFNVRITKDIKYQRSAKALDILRS
nr:hypothetical protein MFMH1_72220 [Myxococcus sp. MH1]